MRYLASIIAAIVGLLGIFADPVQAYIVAHPAIAAIVAAVGAIVTHLMPSPVAPK